MLQSASIDNLCNIFVFKYEQYRQGCSDADIIIRKASGTA